MTRFLGLTERGTILKLEDAHAVTLVLFRNEGRGQGRKSQNGEHNAPGKTSQDVAALDDEQLEQADITGLQPGKETVEAIKDQRQPAAGKAEQHNPEHVGAEAE